MFKPNALQHLPPRAWLAEQRAYLAELVETFRPLAEARPAEYPIFAHLVRQLADTELALGV